MNAILEYSQGVQFLEAILGYYLSLSLVLLFYSLYDNKDILIITAYD